MSPIEVTPTGTPSLLEAFLRDGEPVPEAFGEKLRRAVEAGDIDVLAARSRGQILGVAVLAYRPNIPAGVLFASIEDLYVLPEARRRGVGTALLRAANERCTERGISYVEVQAEDEAAESFYASVGYALEAGTTVLSRSLPLPGA